MYCCERTTIQYISITDHKVSVNDLCKKVGYVNCEIGDHRIPDVCREMLQPVFSVKINKMLFVDLKNI